MQVTDEQLARLVAMDIAIVTHFEGANDWLLDDRVVAEFDRDNPGEQLPLLDRWRDFVDAGLHVASATDAPWTFADQVLLDPIGRPFDQIAAGMDGRVRTSPDPPAWSVDQLLTAEQGLRAVTVDAASAIGDEARRGHLAPGTMGDVTILVAISPRPRPTSPRARGRRHHRRRQRRLLFGRGRLRWTSMSATAGCGSWPSASLPWSAAALQAFAPSDSPPATEGPLDPAPASARGSHCIRSTGSIAAELTSRDARSSCSRQQGRR